MADWALDLLAGLAIDGAGHLKVTFGEKGCFSESWSWLEIRWGGTVFVRGEHNGVKLGPPPIHLDRLRADALARELLEAGQVDEPDEGRSTTGAMVRFEGTYEPVTGQVVSFQAELRSSIGREPSRRIEKLVRVWKSVAERSWPGLE